MSDAMDENRKERRKVPLDSSTLNCMNRTYV